MDEKLTIYERIYSWENLLNAYHEAGREKWFKQDVANFTAHLEENLISIQNELIWRTYSVGRYREFYVYEPKKRLIMALSFRDRVVQWAIYLQPEVQGRGRASLAYGDDHQLRPHALRASTGKERRRSAAL